MIRAAIISLALAAPATAETLRPFDMEDVPYGLFALQGGTFHGQLSNMETPFRSMIFFSCIDCAVRADALVGLAADRRDEGSAAQADPDGFAALQLRICEASDMTECSARAERHAGLQGYGVDAKLGGRWLIEEVYFADGLQFVINASDPEKDIARANVDTLRDAVAPYVTGAAP